VPGSLPTPQRSGSRRTSHFTFCISSPPPNSRLSCLPLLLFRELLITVLVYVVITGMLLRLKTFPPIGVSPFPDSDTPLIFVYGPFFCFRLLCSFVVRLRFPPPSPFPVGSSPLLWAFPRHVRWIFISSGCSFGRLTICRRALGAEVRLSTFTVPRCPPFLPGSQFPRSFLSQFIPGWIGGIFHIPR